MKRFFTFFTTAMLCGQMFAGGIMTNTNQSVMFNRMQARDATLGIDAVYFNPAGLTLLPNNGFFLSLNNQTLGQTKWITSNNPLFNTNPTEYEGKVSAPFFPGVYAAYKMDNLTFSAGFNPIGGGGGASFDTGLPSFEALVAPLVPGLQSQLLPVDQGVELMTGTDPMFRNVSGYTYDISFEGSSVYFGYQANVSYAINDLVSVGIGGRYVTAKNTYSGYLKNIEIIAPEIYDGQQTAGDYLRLIGVQTGMSASLDPVAIVMDATTKDLEVDVIEKGTGFTPIVSLNFNLSEDLNFMLKYEHQTKIELETEVIDGKDGGGMYVNGYKKRADMPSQIAVGAMYKPMDKLMLTTGFHMYLDSKADYGFSDIDANTGNEIKVDNSEYLDNSIEFAIGAEYSLNEQLAVSFGYLLTQTGANEKYHTDLSYSLNSNTIGGGFGYNINEKIQLNLGAQYTMYAETEKMYDGIDKTGVATQYGETYDKDVWVVSVGVNFNFGAGK